MSVAPKRLRAQFSKAASTYDTLARFQHIQTRRVMDAARMLFPARATILDIGCGTGYFAQISSQSEWTIIGLDIAEGMCAEALKHCRALQADAVSLPIGNNTVDAVVSSLCLQWVERLDAAMAEIARVMKPGGRAVIATLGEASLRELRTASAAANLSLSMLNTRALADYVDAAQIAGLEITLYDSTCEVNYYENVHALLNSMRAIGAGNNFAGGAGLTGAARWKAMLAEYELQRTADGIPATWEHIFLVLSKPA